MRQHIDTPHTRLGLQRLGLCIFVVLCLWTVGLGPLEILVAVGGSVLLVLVWIASGLYYDDVEGV